MIVLIVFIPPFNPICLYPTLSACYLRARSTEGLEFSRPGHLAVKIASDFNPSVDCGAVI